jgi:hypothetical protein
MGQRREIRSYDYVNHPYPTVRDALITDTQALFIEATRAATSRARAVAAALQVNIGGLDVSADISLQVGDIKEAPPQSTSPTIRIPIGWQAASKPRLFPLMSAELSVYPLTPTETQLDFLGRYDPPLGKVGDALDAVLGHKIAEASVHRFIADVAHYLRENLGKANPA